MKGDGLARLFGHANRREVVVVTPRGVEIPMNRAEGWTVVALSGLLAEIDALPETMPTRSSSGLSDVRDTE